MSHLYNTAIVGIVIPGLSISQSYGANKERGEVIQRGFLSALHAKSIYQRQATHLN